MASYKDDEGLMEDMPERLRSFFAVVLVLMWVVLLGVFAFVLL
ncbi:hypothetical protein ACFLRC_01670 [Candidatus Altiarchaeota archaeon]